MKNPDEFRLDDKVALITGGARGIGYAVAELFGAVGAKLAIADINPAEGEQAVARLRETGHQAIYLPGDLTDAEVAAETVAATVGEYGSLDVVVNSVGICENTDAVDIPAAEWRRVMDTNVDSLFWVCQAASRQMIGQGGGSIVNIGSGSGLVADKPQPQAHYNASKAAVHMMTKSLAVELAPRNIRVNAVAPGFVLTEMTKLGLSKTEWSSVWKENTPMKRFAEPEEIASAVLFLASSAASFITGSILVVDGGYTCW